ncbi:hypothetical protein [Shewanella algae]|uniref:hypothetical protein n=1 Tax=Shewanella algae TaxID=38313 RepID=UPI001AAD3AC7|nr:hypothetical protein [Shewanella algae]MBO2618329.1 hypothetical protein [Shewanella algae]
MGLMTWKGFTIGGVFKDLSHLTPFGITVDINGTQVSVVFSYHNHVFTDKKAAGEKLRIQGETRYWSEDRYELSRTLPELIRAQFLDKYAVPYLNKDSNEQYHYMEIHDYAIFFEISTPTKSPNELRVKIISAYEPDRWGAGTLPKGKAYKVRWILSKRYNGEFVL